MWSALTPRTIGDVPRTTVILHSISFDVPAFITPVFPAYEERYLCLVLSLLRAPRSHVVYVTSQPILPRTVDYFFGLVPDLDTPSAHQRLHLVSVGDGRPRPLTEKVLARPRTVDRIRSLIVDPDKALIIPFNTSELEQRLALELGIPVYGPDPALARFGTKSGGRRLFAEEDVPHAMGFEGLGSIGEVTDAIEALRGERPHVREVILKLDRGVSGLGNALVRLQDSDLETCVRQAELEDPAVERDEFFALLEKEGAVVEERITGDEVRDPSVSIRISPAGDVEVLATHDQVLGGANAMSYLGCRFPADRAYAGIIAEQALKVGHRLAREGAIGRFSIDFVVTRSGDEWRAHAIEINLRNGGTTHPLLTLQALTDGEYRHDDGYFRTDVGARHYFATDHLEHEAYASLTPDDFFDLMDEQGLGWDPGGQTGVVFHMVSAVAVAGRVGVTAIGDSPDDAHRRYRVVKQVMDDACGVVRG